MGSETHAGDIWCFNPIAPLRHPARPPTNPLGVIEVGASVRWGPFVPPLPCFDEWWSARPGLARFDLTELTRRGYGPGYLRAELRAKALPDPSADRLPNAGPSCDRREFKIEPLATGEWNLTDRNAGLNRPDLLVRMSGSGTADITPLVEYWHRGGANHGLSIELDTTGFFGIADEAHGEINRRCMHRFALTLQVASTITGSPLVLAPQPASGAGMRPPMMGTDQPMVVHGVARRGTAPVRVAGDVPDRADARPADARIRGRAAGAGHRDAVGGRVAGISERSAIDSAPAVPQHLASDERPDAV